MSRTIIRSFPDFRIVMECSKGREFYVVVSKDGNKDVINTADYDVAYKEAVLRQESISRERHPQGYALIRLHKTGNFEVVRTTARTHNGLIWIYEIRDLRSGAVVDSSKSYSKMCSEAFRYARREGVA